MELPNKPLTDVIKAVEICAGCGACFKCPYYVKDGRNLCLLTEGNQMLKDVYYWLKKTRKMIYGI